MRDSAEYKGNLPICKLDISQPFRNEKGEIAAFNENRASQKCKVSNYKVIRHVLCERFTMSEMKTSTKCETYASTSRKKLSRLHEDSQRKKLRFCDSSTANYRFINKMELTKRLNNAQKEKQKSIQRAMRLTLSSNNQTASEAAKTSKEQHCTLRCIV